jgi:hypothetical protein
MIDLDKLVAAVREQVPDVRVIPDVEDDAVIFKLRREYPITTFKVWNDSDITPLSAIRTREGRHLMRAICDAVDAQEVSGE